MMSVMQHMIVRTSQSSEASFSVFRRFKVSSDVDDVAASEKLFL